MDLESLALRLTSSASQASKALFSPNKDVEMDDTTKGVEGTEGSDKTAVE